MCRSVRNGPFRQAMDALANRRFDTSYPALLDKSDPPQRLSCEACVASAVQHRCQKNLPNTIQNLSVVNAHPTWRHVAL